MLVYGDMEREEEAAAVRASVAETLLAARRTRPGLARHALLVEAFILAGELVQGIVDEEGEARGFDAASPSHDAGLKLVCALAGLVGFSWGNRFALAPALTEAAAGALADVRWSGAVRLRQAEGFALYALYPETYWEAARGSGLPPATRVIGIRSIGLSLGAVVSAALGARPPVTLRPGGHPFGRKVEIAPSLRRDLLAHPRASFAVVDEGPGLSGSSFAAVSGLLREGGVAPRSIHFFPSHAHGPGTRASAEIKARWEESPHAFRSFEATIGEAEARHHRLDRWAADLIGPLDAPLEDIGGGGWRAHLARGGALPADARLERRKFLAHAGGGRFLLKFAGLGAAGRRKLETARLLSEAGFAARPLGLCHGMLVERWIEGPPAPAALDRQALLARLGAYLGFRAKRLEAVNPGASLARLRDMACFNAGEALGREAAEPLKAFFARAGNWSGVARPVNTDNRLHRWEWRTDTAGALLKTDALDHSSGHDLVGCQDIAWDVAGAMVEFDLNETEAAALRDAVGAACGRRVERHLVALLLPCYLVFQLGLWTMAVQAAGPADAERNRREGERYRDSLTIWLGRLERAA